MANRKKTWTEKLNPTAIPKVETLAKNFADIPAGAKMLVPTPMMVRDYVLQIPKGTSTNIRQMRRDLAATHQADFCCPLTSGIFLRIVAEHAWELIQQGADLETVPPFWRVVDARSTTAKKLSFGTEFLSQQRTRENLADGPVPA